MSDTQHLLIILNFAVCTFIGIASLVRIKSMKKSTTLWTWRIKYALLFGAATASGWSPLFFSELPGVGQVLTGLAFLSIIGLGQKTWGKNGPPLYARKSHVSQT